MGSGGVGSYLGARLVRSGLDTIFVAARTFAACAVEDSERFSSETWLYPAPPMACIAGPASAVSAQNLRDRTRAGRPSFWLGWRNTPPMTWPRPRINAGSLLSAKFLCPGRATERSQSRALQSVHHATSRPDVKIRGLCFSWPAGRRLRLQVAKIENRTGLRRDCKDVLRLLRVDVPRETLTRRAESTKHVIARIQRNIVRRCLPRRVRAPELAVRCG
jgi:hypothetical protein